MTEKCGSNLGRHVGRAGLLAAVTVAAAFISGCDRKESARQASKPAPADAVVIYTTFYPTAYFAERIVGDQAEVVNPCPPDADPAFWTPDEQTIAAYQKADLIVVNGASFEKWVSTASLPAARVVDTTKPFESEFIVLKSKVTHSHGPSGAHTHEGVDGHTWLDPINAKAQAGEILRALVKLRPEQKAAFEKGYADLAKDFDALDAQLKQLSDKIGDQSLFCGHPAYNYVGRRYGWNLVSFHLDPEEMPDAEALAEIKAHLETHPSRLMLWEAPPSQEVAARMSELGLTGVVFSPCEALEPDELSNGVDFLTVMNANVDRLSAALGD